MPQTREEISANLAERVCWQLARRDDLRVARRLYRKQIVDAVYQLDEGALLDDFFYFLQQLGVIDWLGSVQGTVVMVRYATLARVGCKPFSAIVPMGCPLICSTDVDVLWLLATFGDSG
jgi:predicted aminopeptidase